MATAPAYATTPRTPYVQATAANTNRDGTGTIATLMTGVAAGSRVGSVTITAVGTTTAGVVRLYVSNDGGTTIRLIAEILVTAITPSTTVATFTFTWVPPAGALVLADASASLRVSTHNAETFNVFANLAGDF